MNVLDISVSPNQHQTGFLGLLNGTGTPYLPGDPAAAYLTPGYLAPSFEDVSSSGWNLPTPILHSTALDYDVPLADSATDPSADQSSMLNQLKDDVIHRLRGKKGGEQIGLNGYLYSHDRKKELSGGTYRHYWQCTMRGSKKLKCTARLITTAEDPPSVVKEPSHAHQPDPTQISMATVKTR